MINNSPKYNYPWLQKAPIKSEDYLDPTYYNHLLKSYSFGGKSDIDLLDEYLADLSTATRVLELGCGSGRATERIVNNLTAIDSIDLVDLSKRMVFFCRERFKDSLKVKAYRSDSINFLKSDSTYNLVISLWNISHSIHQHMFRLGRKEGSLYVQKILKDFILNRLDRSGNIYLVHYDIQSPEQRLINPWRLKLWEKADPTYDASTQSPSKLLLDEIFTDLKNSGHINYECDHLKGDPIEYDNVDVALETFLNFHMEGYFNCRPELPEVIRSLLDGFRPYISSSGLVRISPGAFIYKVVRI